MSSVSLVIPPPPKSALPPTPIPYGTLQFQTHSQAKFRVTRISDYPMQETHQIAQNPRSAGCEHTIVLSKIDGHSFLFEFTEPPSNTSTPSDMLRITASSVIRSYSATTLHISSKERVWTLSSEDPGLILKWKQLIQQSTIPCISPPTSPRLHQSRIMSPLATSPPPLSYPLASPRSPASSTPSLTNTSIEYSSPLVPHTRTPSFFKSFRK
ncbi:hypothetical protein BCR33DRAFT_720632 [Rhizoclosmatium globosum]|uniref:Uncharacterized protein n=1 Tax=Rhizoclosmatium globosum TaxID=329046 RepID=A0A1Y2BV26_9FUNG|nr:hypothetical protein BCR33DRAFT_720632 [Rhizoclosmatium globosum]|eukprot:ORY38609.1 hypothetical protein BCR33DRAFT_720632 [Rhizoclosmatium globosum]